MRIESELVGGLRRRVIALTVGRIEMKGGKWIEKTGDGIEKEKKQIDLKWVQKDYR